MTTAKPRESAKYGDRARGVTDISGNSDVALQYQDICNKLLHKKLQSNDGVDSSKINPIAIDDIKTLHDLIQTNIGSIQQKTCQILQDQEEELLRSFGSRLGTVDEQLKEERAKSASGATEWIDKCHKMSDELNWLKTEAATIECENRKLKERVRGLEWQLENADADRKVMARKLIALKRENQRLRRNDGGNNDGKHFASADTAINERTHLSSDELDNRLQQQKQQQPFYNHEQTANKHDDDEKETNGHENERECRGRGGRGPTKEGVDVRSDHPVARSGHKSRVHESAVTQSDTDGMTFSPSVTELLPPHLQTTAAYAAAAAAAASHSDPVAARALSHVAAQRTVRSQASGDSGFAPPIGHPRLGLSTSSERRSVRTVSPPRRKVKNRSSRSRKKKGHHRSQKGRRRSMLGGVLSRGEDNPWSMSQDFSHHSYDESSGADGADSESTPFPTMGENSRAYAQASPISPRHTHNITARTLFVGSLPLAVRTKRPTSKDPTSSRASTAIISTNLAKGRPVPRHPLSARVHTPRTFHVVDTLGNHPLSARARRTRVRPYCIGTHNAHPANHPLSARSSSPQSEQPHVKLVAREALKSLEATLGKE